MWHLIALVPPASQVPSPCAHGLPIPPRRSTREFPLGFIVTRPKTVHLSTKAAAALNCAADASLLSGSSANGSDGPAH